MRTSIFTCTFFFNVKRIISPCNKFCFKWMILAKKHVKKMFSWKKWIDYRHQKILPYSKDTLKSSKSFFFSLQKLNVIKNSNGCWRHIFWNIPLGSTNSFVKNKDKKSKNIRKHCIVNLLVIVLNKLCKCLYLPELKTNSIKSKIKLLFSNEKSTKL